MTQKRKNEKPPKKKKQFKCFVMIKTVEYKNDSGSDFINAFCILCQPNVH